ncbi:hypothetical protein LCGC14_1113160 [marine sediment metagenome]|uniref:Uncharacterized protein n=1 Tax=marine sediment metagenome TaxID=412755 RepID=A0A0F9M656_9ZZZZ
MNDQQTQDLARINTQRDTAIEEQDFDDPLFYPDNHIRDWRKLHPEFMAPPIDQTREQYRMHVPDHDLLYLRDPTPAELHRIIELYGDTSLDHPDERCDEEDEWDPTDPKSAARIYQRKAQERLANEAPDRLPASTCDHSVDSEPFRYTHETSRPGYRELAKMIVAFVAGAIVLYVLLGR